MRNLFCRLIQNYLLGLLLGEDARNRTEWTVCYLLVGVREGQKIRIYLNLFLSSEINVERTNNYEDYLSIGMAR